MGNKQGKAASAATTVQAASRFKNSTRRDNATGAQPATQPPPIEKPENPETLSSTSIPTDEAAPHISDMPKAEAVEKPEHEEKEIAEKPEDKKEETVEKPTVVMPSLDLEKVDRNPPLEIPEDDPDLMAPPLFLTDAMSPLTDSDHQPKPKQSSSNEAVFIASPITHGEVSLDAPEPARTPIEVPPERDDVSIDEQVSAAGEDLPTEPKESASEEIVLSAFERVPGHIPEDAASLTSSVARGEDELLKNIMGSSLALPALTSNESVRGSVAVSDYFVDETHWENPRRTESTERPMPESPQMVSVALHSVEDGVALTFGYEASETSTKVVPKPQEFPAPEEVVIESAELEAKVSEPSHGDGVVKEVVDSIFTGVIQQSIDSEVQEMEADEESQVSMQLTEVGGTLKVQLSTMDEPTQRAESYPSEISSKQLSVDLNTPFVNCYGIDDSMHSTDEIPEKAVQTTKIAAVESKEETADPQIKSESADEKTSLVDTSLVETTVETMTVKVVAPPEPTIEDTDPQEIAVDPETEVTSEPPIDVAGIHETKPSVEETAERVTEAAVAEVIQPMTEDPDPKEEEAATLGTEQLDTSCVSVTERTDAVDEVTETTAIDPKTDVTDLLIDEVDPIEQEVDPIAEEAHTLEKVPSGDVKKPRKSKSRKKKKKTGTKDSTSPGPKTISDGSASVDT